MFTSKQTCYCCVIPPVPRENFICIYHISSIISRLYFNVSKFKYFNLSSYLSVLTAITSYVALFCTFFLIFQSVACDVDTIHYNGMF